MADENRLLVQTPRLVSASMWKGRMFSRDEIPARMISEE